MKQNIKFIILGLIIITGINHAQAANFSYPCAAGAPECNTPLPINSSSTPQSKLGPLSIGTSVKPGPGFIFNAPAGKSFFAGLLTKGLVIRTNAGEGKVLKYNAGTGVAGWGNLSTLSGNTTMTIKDFSITVPRNANATGGVSASIPATYQYCAINQLGPDFSNSDRGDERIATICSVNRNSDGTWRLFGNRMDDPDFVCKASCLSFDTKTAEYDKTNFIPSPGILDATQNGIMESQIEGTRRIYIR